MNATWKRTQGLIAWWATWLALGLFLSLPGMAGAQVVTQASPFVLPVGSNFAMAVLVVGFCMSPVISFLNRRDWSAEGKAIGAFVWSFLAAGILFAAGDKFDLAQREPSILFGTFLAIFVMATGLYQFYFKPSGLADKIERSTG